jgi:hypothetical protein
MNNSIGPSMISRESKVVGGLRIKCYLEKQMEYRP